MLNPLNLKKAGISYQTNVEEVPAAPAEEETSHPAHLSDLPDLITSPCSPSSSSLLLLDERLPLLLASQPLLWFLPKSSPHWRTQLTAVGSHHLARLPFPS